MGRKEETKKQRSAVKEGKRRKKGERVGVGVGLLY